MMRHRTAIRFAVSGWTETSLSADKMTEGALRVWENGAEGELSLHHFDMEPDVAAPLSHIVAIRRQYRDLVAGNGGALISVDTVEVSGIPALKTILKFPQDPAGMTYVGSITLPFTRSSYVIRVVCPETGVTGVRDAVVADKLGFVREGGDAGDWFSDPYEPEFNSAVLRNRSDDQDWDAAFPDHPLSRVRSALDAIANSCEVSREVRELRPFRGPGKAMGWWSRLTEP